MISEGRLAETLRKANQMGDYEFCKQYQINPETLARYKRIKERDKSATLPKILLFDIETAPNLVYTWGLYDQNVGLSQIVRPSFMLSWAAKWLFSDEIMSEVVTPVYARKGDDFLIMQPLWDLLDEADIVIAHNGDKFDIPWANARFLMHGMVPPSPYQSIDTLKVAKKFYLTSRKLDFLGKEFVGYQKIKTDFDLWKGCMEGDRTSLAEMVRYNRQDVQLLEDVYLRLRPWIRSHPNLNLYMTTENRVCANCGSSDLEEISKPYVTTVGKYQTFRCKCGAINRNGENQLSNTKKILRGVAR